MNRSIVALGVLAVGALVGSFVVLNHKQCTGACNFLITNTGGYQWSDPGTTEITDKGKKVDWQIANQTGADIVVRMWHFRRLDPPRDPHAPCIGDFNGPYKDCGEEERISNTQSSTFELKAKNAVKGETWKFDLAVVHPDGTTEDIRPVDPELQIDSNDAPIVGGILAIIGILLLLGAGVQAMQKQ